MRYEYVSGCQVGLLGASEVTREAVKPLTWTAYRSQVSMSEESHLVLGEVATRALARRQFYVGNIRFRGAHAIYVSRKDEILRRLVQLEEGRDLATEFMERHRLSENEKLVLRPARGRRTQWRI